LTYHDRFHEEAKSGVMTEMAEVQYKADITAGALKVPESRVSAGLLLRGVGQQGWNEAIVNKNVLQARRPKTAKRLTLLIRGRLETMGEELWRLVRDGKGDVATHAVLAAAVKHTRQPRSRRLRGGGCQHPGTRDPRRWWRCPGVEALHPAEQGLKTTSSNRSRVRSGSRSCTQSHKV
jgi:hypothetical protein